MEIFFEVGICVVVVSYDVLLATYNGSLYLKEQLLSILAQTYPPHRIIISDDMSSDSTLDIVYSFINSTTKPIYLLPSPGVKLGCCKNFERLLAFSDSNYVMFSDQDDIWDLNKAEKLLNTMIYHESRHESSYPLLVHSDLRLIDSSGGFLQQSFLKYQSLNPAHNQWHQIAMQNIVSGCSCLVNRKCIDLALPFPPSVIMHDWWLALVASRMGKVIYLDTPTISYRQHSLNVVGAKGFTNQVKYRISQLFVPNAFHEWIGKPIYQLRALHNIYPTDEQLNFLINHLTSKNPFLRIFCALRLRLGKHGFLRSFVFFLILFMWSPNPAKSYDA